MQPTRNSLLGRDERITNPKVLAGVWRICQLEERSLSFLISRVASKKRQYPDADSSTSGVHFAGFLLMTNGQRPHGLSEIG
jgi:hypothetical protein